VSKQTRYRRNHNTQQPMTGMPGLLTGRNVVNPGARSLRLTLVGKIILLNALLQNQTLRKVFILSKLSNSIVLMLSGCLQFMSMVVGL
jgi:hypothetical protein